MYQCEQKKTFVENTSEYKQKWVVVEVSSLGGVDKKKIRCMHCHGRVRIHNQQVEHGPQDHVEHLSRQDSEGCQGGTYFKGEHRQSLEPVS